MSERAVPAGVVVAMEFVNEPFLTLPLDIVNNFYKEVCALSLFGALLNHCLAGVSPHSSRQPAAVHIGERRVPIRSDDQRVAAAFVRRRLLGHVRCNTCSCSSFLQLSAGLASRHIYQVFDAYRLSFTEQQHIDQSCKINKPEIAAAQMRVITGEWSLAITDCAEWLNGSTALAFAISS